MQPHPLTFHAGEPLTEARARLDAIRQDFNWLHLHRSLFWPVIRALDTGTGPASQTWRAHYARLYVDAQTIGVRRLIGGTRPQAEERCLSRVLTILIDAHRTITVDRIARIHANVAGHHDPHLIGRHVDAVEREWGNGTGHLDSGKIEGDLDTLRADARAVTRWADTTVAHLDRDPTAAPTFSELDKSIADATATFRDYGRLLTGNDYAVDHNAPDLSWWIPLRGLFSQDGPTD